MVSISRSRVKSMKVRSRGTGTNSKELFQMGLAAVFVLSLITFYGMTTTTTRSSSSDVASRRQEALRHPNLQIITNVDTTHASIERERYNAVALDILRTLECERIFDEATQQLKNQAEQQQNNYAQELSENQGMYRDIKQRRRRLDEDPNEFGDTEEMLDDAMFGEESYFYNPDLTARHLFCLAAFDDPAADKGAAYFQERIQCDASHSRRQSLLELWESGRAALRSTELLTRVVDDAVEQQVNLLDHNMYVWAPVLDDGMKYTLSTLNDEERKNADQGGLYGLSHNLGPGKYFVDVGSCLGFTSMAIAIMYPGTKIISIEAAAPTWLMQELNWRCQPNDHIIASQEPYVTRVLAGVGPVSGGNQFALMLWRPDSTTSTRSWTAKSDQKETDVELSVELKPWHNILAEVGLESSHEIDVLYVDCEGCEYNLIPAMTESEFSSLSTVVGEMHWGYIPKSKLPSSERASITHERLCAHENMARTAKECCAFPDMPVISSVPGEVLLHEEEGQTTDHFPPVSATVSDVAGDLCDDFEEWAKGKFLRDIESDWGWFQISSTADDA